MYRARDLLDGSNVVQEEPGARCNHWTTDEKASKLPEKGTKKGSTGNWTRDLLQLDYTSSARGVTPEAGIILLDHWADVRKGMSKYIEQISTERPTHSQQILTSDCPRKKTQSSCIHLATNHHAYISCPISTLQIQPSVVGHINTYHTWGVSSW